MQCSSPRDDLPSNEVYPVAYIHLLFVRAYAMPILPNILDGCHTLATVESFLAETISCISTPQSGWFFP